MYVCTCKAVTENQIICAISDGDNSLDLLRNRLTAGKNCGKCIAAIESLLTEHKDPAHEGLPTLQTMPRR